MKTCTVCRELKSLVEFYNSKAYKDGKSYRCKSCDKLARRKYNEKHRKQRLINQRKANLKHKYGMSVKDFDNLWEKQKGCCAICNKKLSNDSGRNHRHDKVVVDHCHTTKKVRGLLCTMCNKGIGLLKDDKSIVKNALTYLQNAEIH